MKKEYADVMSRDTVQFQYNGERYTFTVDKSRKPFDKQNGCAVFFGYFQNKAPGDLQLNKTYCLKLVVSRNPGLLTCAACREVYDIIPFEGAHIRKILIQSDSARKVANAVKKGEAVEQGEECVTIEPCYSSLYDHFTNCSNYDPWTRLDIVRQCALGAKELSDDANRIAKCAVLAHRDLKWQNIVTETINGQLRVRLVDFATIWLSEADRIGTTRKTGMTKKGMISPENTSPESLVESLNVGPHTDVYALGMMLASLFMCCDESYVNPSDLWISTLRKKNFGIEENKLITGAVQECQRYKVDPAAGIGWIEQDLKRLGKTIAWENLQNGKVLAGIRSLYCRATCIEPSDRISLDDFIEELERIMHTAKGCQPMSIYLFNGANADQYRRAYQAAIEQAWGMDTEEVSSPWALFVSYNNFAPGKKMDDCICLEHYSTETELENRVAKLESGKGADRDPMLYALYKAYWFLKENQDRFDFSGQVYLFTPEIPTEEAIHPFDSGDAQYDRWAFSQETLDQLQRKQTKYVAFTVKAPTGDTADEWEYSQISVPAASESKPVEKHTGNSVSDYEFDTGPTGLYVTLRDGRKVYVGMVKT